MKRLLATALSALALICSCTGNQGLPDDCGDYYLEREYQNLSMVYIDTNDCPFAEDKTLFYAQLMSSCLTKVIFSCLQDVAPCSSEPGITLSGFIDQSGNVDGIQWDVWDCTLRYSSGLYNSLQCTDSDGETCTIAGNFVQPTNCYSSPCSY